MPSDAMHKMAEVLKRKEELHPDLARYIITGAGVKQIKHPLVVSLFYKPELNAVYNEQYRRKQDLLLRFTQLRDWRRLVFLYERSSRIFVLSDIQSRMTDDEYWMVVGAVLNDTDNLHQYGDLLSSILLNSRGGREKMMRPGEVKFVQSLPDTFYVYRAHMGDNKRGWSWTLDYEKAKEIAEHLVPKKKGVVRAKANKVDVLTIFLRRRLYECVIAPNKVGRPLAYSGGDWVRPAYLEKK